MIITRYLKEVGFSPKGLVHVGAHRAQEVGDYLDLGIGRIVWVEADPDQIDALEKAVAESGAPERQLVVQALIADKNGQRMPFHRFSNNGESSSLFRATQILTDHWPSVGETGEVILLETRRLEDALHDAGVRASDIDVLVLDVQGAEVLALAGAGAFVQSARYIEVEVSREGIYAGAPLFEDVRDVLDTLGFEPVTEIPWHGDVVFARKHASTIG